MLSNTKNILGKGEAESSNLSSSTIAKTVIFISENCLSMRFFTGSRACLDVSTKIEHIVNIIDLTSPPPRFQEADDATY